MWSSVNSWGGAVSGVACVRDSSDKVTPPSVGSGDITMAAPAVLLSSTGLILSLSVARSDVGLARNSSLVAFRRHVGAALSEPGALGERGRLLLGLPLA